MNKPNFCIVGAPKCGTTALYEYLRTHPNVFLPELKEPHYFASDFPEYRAIHSLNDYAKLFEPCRNQHLAIGEASVFYLFSQKAVRSLMDFNPNMKLIVMLRNPVSMAHSLHSQLLFGFREEEKDFQKAWRLQPIRATGRCLPRHCRAPEHLQYGAVCKLGEQVERLLKVVPREQVKIIPLDDLVASPQQVYDDVLSFLELPHDGRDTFPQVNQNKVHRWDRVTWFLAHPPFPLNLLKRGVLRIFPSKEAWVRRQVHKLACRNASRTVVQSDFRHELVCYFRSDIEKLEHILDRDFGHWAA